MTNSNREKNIAHEARQATRTRPVSPVYNFEDLERAVRSWVAGPEQEEIYSPYYGA